MSSRGVRRVQPRVVPKKEPLPERGGVKPCTNTLINYTKTVKVRIIQILIIDCLNSGRRYIMEGCCGCGETIITSAFQAEVAGLIPAARTRKEILILEETFAAINRLLSPCLQSPAILAK